MLVREPRWRNQALLRLLYGAGLRVVELASLCSSAMRPLLLAMITAISRTRDGKPGSLPSTSPIPFSTRRVSEHSVMEVYKQVLLPQVQLAYGLTRRTDQPEPTEAELVPWRVTTSFRELRTVGPIESQGSWI